METKKLRAILFAFVLSTFAFINTTKAVTYYWCGTGSITDRLQWWTLNTCTGSHPANFTHASDVWNIKTAGSYSLTADWILGSSATVVVGFGGTAVSLATNGHKITKSGAANITLSIPATGTLDIGSNNFPTLSNVTLSLAAGSTVVYSVANSVLYSVTYSNLVFSANNTLNVTTINNDFTNSATATISNNLAITHDLINSGTISMGSGGTSITIGNDFNNTGTYSAINSSALTLNGTVSSAGTVTGDGTGFIYFNGAGAFTISMDQTTAGISNSMFEVQNSGAGTLTLGNAMCIAPGGDITPNSGIVDIGSSLLTLLAGQGSSGAIGTIGGTLNGGTIISQMYHNPNGNSTTWTTISTPGLTDANFQQFTGAFPITCASCLDGSTVSGSPFTSVTSYDETATGGGDYNNSAHYIDLPSDANTVNNGQGYWVYMGNSSPSTSTGAETITMGGTPQQGNVPIGFSFTNASNGYNLLANPYPSPISWSTLMSNTSNGSGKMDGTAYIYNPQDGSYSTLDAAGLASGSYGMNDDIIPTGMAFYVKATGGGSLMFDESIKIPGTTQDLQRQSNHQSPQQIAQIKRFSIQALGTGMKSQTMFAFDGRASVGADNIIDAPYLIGSEPLRVTSQIGGNDYSINGLPDYNANYNIPVSMIVTTTGSYTISAVNLNLVPSGACLILHDNLTSTDYDLRQGPAVITLNNTDVGARFVLNMASSSLAITVNATQATCPASNNGYIVAAGTSAGPWNYVWKNSNNVIVKTTLNKNSADTLMGLGAGDYSVDVNTVGSCDNGTQTVSMTLPSAPVLSITSSITNASCNSASDGYITAIGNSAGPWNYTWKDANGNVVQTSLNKNSADVLPNLNGGNYSVEISTTGSCDFGTQTFALTIPNEAVSAFSVSSATINVGNSVTFTNNSTDATTYWWTFGDGGTSTTQSPMYTYTSAGIDTAKLYAFNPICNDTVSSFQVITVMGSTGIAASHASGDVFITKDQTGSYIKFNYGAQTKVNITVYNALGQVILAENSHLVTSDKIYLNIENAKDQMIFVTIANLDKNTTVTKKLFNN
jgi:PKD repeat protein